MSLNGVIELSCHTFPVITNVNCFYSFPLESQGFSPSISHTFPHDTVFALDFPQISIDFPWISIDFPQISLVFPWFSPGFPLHFPCRSPATGRDASQAEGHGEGTALRGLLHGVLGGAKLSYQQSYYQQASRILIVL